MSEKRVIFIGKKPLHAYVKAVAMAMQEGDMELQLSARGATIGRAVDVAEVCKRRNGIIAQELPANVEIGQIQSGSVEVESRNGEMRTISTITIDLRGSE